MEESVERIVRLHVEKLPEGFWLATSDDVQGLVAQGRTVAETLEIARDVARRLLEAKAERAAAPDLSEPTDSFDYPLVIAL
jgi:predicted RNase H-like HicB family nuclease